VRQLLDWALEPERLGPRVEARRTPQGLTIRLRVELLHCIRLAAGMPNPDTIAPVQTMLTQHIDEHIQMGEQKTAELTPLLHV
jgi:hypothetical protein